MNHLLASLFLVMAVTASFQEISLQITRIVAAHKGMEAKAQSLFIVPAILWGLFYITMQWNEI